MFFRPSVHTLLLCIIALLYAPVLAEDARTKKVLEADDARIAAMVSADSRSLEPLLSEDLQYSHSTGSVDTKETLLSLIEKKEIRYVAYQPVERAVAFSGSDIAFINGRAEIGVQHEGQSFEKTFVTFSVWRLEEDVWRFLRWQSSQIASAALAVGDVRIIDKSARDGGWRAPM